MRKFLKFIFGRKLYMFRTVLLLVMRSFSLYTQQWYMSYRFADSLRAGAYAPARQLSDEMELLSISSMTRTGSNIGGQYQKL